MLGCNAYTKPKCINTVSFNLRSRPHWGPKTHLRVLATYRKEKIKDYWIRAPSVNREGGTSVPLQTPDPVLLRFLAIVLN